MHQLNLLRTLIMWALSDSEAIGAIIKEKYKQSRHNDDENQPLSVQPWGFDGDKRRYFLVQGLDDTSFRVYREGGRYSKSPHWYSVAGTIDEVKELAKKLEELDTTQAARRLAGRITNAIPTFEATEEVSCNSGTINIGSMVLIHHSRSVDVASIARYDEQHSPAPSLAFRYTKVEQEASACDTTMMTTTPLIQMPLPLDALPGNQVDLRHSRLCRQSPRVGDRLDSRGLASTARAYSVPHR